MRYAVQLGKLVDKVGVRIFEANLQIQFDRTGRDALAFQRMLCDAARDKPACRFFRRRIGAMDDQDIGIVIFRRLREEQQHDPDREAAEDSQWDEASRQHDAACDAPEQKCDLGRFFDRGPKTHDRQSADHSEREHDVAGHGENEQRRDHIERDQRNPEACGIHHAGIGALVDVEDEEAQRKGQQQRQRHIEGGDGGDIFQKAGFENILKIESHNAS